MYVILCLILIRDTKYQLACKITIKKAYVQEKSKKVYFLNKKAGILPA